MPRAIALSFALLLLRRFLRSRTSDAPCHHNGREAKHRPVSLRREVVRQRWRAGSVPICPVGARAQTFYSTRPPMKDGTTLDKMINGRKKRNTGVPSGTPPPTRPGSRSFGGELLKPRKLEPPFYLPDACSRIIKPGLKIRTAQHRWQRSLILNASIRRINRSPPIHSGTMLPLAVQSVGIRYSRLCRTRTSEVLVRRIPLSAASVTFAAGLSALIPRSIYYDCM
jgi:hypothetical protein